MSKTDFQTVKTVNDLNISRADVKSASALEQRAAHISEKVRFLFAEYERLAPELPAAFRDMITRPKVEIPAGTVITDEVQSLFTAEGIFDSVYASKALLSMYEEKEKTGIRDYIANPDNTVQSIAYLKNALADSAYKVFEKAFDEPSVVYAGDFNAVCEAVYYEKAGYCILPIESSADGRLAGFYSLIDKYELSVVLSCRIVSHLGTAFTTFVLCSKKPAIFYPDKTSRLAEVQIRHSGFEIYRLLTAAQIYGLDTAKCETLPSAEGNIDSILFSGTDNQIKNLLYYLFLTGCRYTLLGIYTEAE